MCHLLSMKTTHLLSLFLLVACGSDATKSPTGGEDSAAPGADVSERLSDGQVRAGVVANSAALFGGVSAEGREGDLKIYNSRVQFIIQGIRESGYYTQLGGGILDADIVRGPGVPGRDAIDDFSVMAGFGLLLSPESVTVVSDGSDGAAAVVRATGRGTPMTLLTGALESETMVPAYEVAIETDYILRPDAHTMEVVTTVTWEDTPTAVQMGDIVMVGAETVDTILPGRGRPDGAEAPTGEWMSVVARDGEMAFGVFSDGDTFASSGVGTLLSELGPVIAPLYTPVELAAGDTATFRRTVGVAPDLATLTDAWHQQQGTATTTVGGVVTADGQPVAGARVHLLNGDAFETMARTDAEGRWSAEVVAANPTAIATGRGTGEWVDLPAGAGWMAPYAHPDIEAAVLQSLADGAEPTPHAEGFGISEPVAATADTTLTLTPPGTLSVTVADGGPAVVRVDFAAGDPVSAPRALVPGRPGGAAMVGYVRDGDLDIPVEPGDYLVTVHRGLRFEPVQQTITIESGQTAELSASLEPALFPDGFLALDPHSHASPSGDGDLLMAHRLLTMAANGVQVHFGTDHDHVADYRPMLAPLSLDGVLTSIVANEASPVLRGHTNVYPVSLDAARANAGAPRWWEGVETTESWFAELRAWAGPDALIQLNHPAESSGMLSAAAYNTTEGAVNKPDFFATDFQAIEVLNAGSYSEALELYLDLIGRGYTATPTGVSDAHGYRNGVGENLTWLPAGVDTPGALTDALLSARMREGQTIVSRGPFLDVRINGAWAPGTTVTGSQVLDVTISGPSFVKVDTLVLLENGVEVDRLETDSGGWFELNPSADAHYVVVASGSESMSPVYGQTPWAMCAAIKVDVDGDGWQAPLPPLGMGD